MSHEPIKQDFTDPTMWDETNGGEDLPEAFFSADGLEINPCVEYRHPNGDSYVEQVDLDLDDLTDAERGAIFWSVYMHHVGFGADCLSDHLSFDEAMTVAKKMRARHPKGDELPIS